MPAWIRWLVERVCPPHRRDEIVGDLEEMHRRRRERGNAVSAGVLTLLEALAVTGHLLRDRVARGVERGALTASELRLALRLLRRSPGVSLTVILALTCGVALATAGFTVVRSVFAVELPFPEGDRVVTVEFRDARTLEPRELPPTLLDALDAGVGSLARWGVVQTSTGNLRLAPDDVTLVEVVALDPHGLDYAVPPPRLGQGLGPEGRDAEGPRPALISTSLWRGRLGGEADAVGRVLEVSGHSYRVLGVLPEEAGFPSRADLWTVHRPDADGLRGATLYGLLSPGASVEAARAELDGLARGVAETTGVPGLTTRLRRVEDPPGSGSQGVLVVGFLLAFLAVIAGNVGNLMVARASARAGELTVRAALGAHRSRLVAQLALEAAVLVGVSVALGLWISDRLLEWFRVSEGGQLPPWVDLSPGPWTLLFVVGVAALLVLVSGILPALRATRGTAPALRSGGGGSTPPAFGWAQSTMIVAQIASATGILGGAVLVQRAWAGALDMETLPAAPAIATAWVSTDDGSVPPALLDAVAAAHPGSRPAFSTYLPGVDAPRDVVEVEGRDEPLQVPVARVSPGFYATLGVDALAGTLPADGDPGDPPLPVAVVDRPFVEAHLGGSNAVGRRIRLAGGTESAGTWFRVVAVVPDLGLGGMDADAAGGIYLPFTPTATARLLVRTPDDPGVLGRTLPGIAYGVDPGLSVSRIHTLEGVVSGVRNVFRGLGAVFTGLGALVLGLALMGVYAILSFEVSRSRREIGIRVALGASARDVIRPLLIRVAAYVAVGGGLGWLLGSGVVSLARATIQLRVAPGGAGVFPLLVLAVLATAGAAALAPALRALRVQPGEALRAE